MVQELWQAYQILSIIFLKQIIELNINTETMMKNLKLVELDKKYQTVSMNTHLLKMIFNRIQMFLLLQKLPINV